MRCVLYVILRLPYKAKVSDQFDTGPLYVPDYVLHLPIALLLL